MPTENRNLRFICSSLSHNNFHIETFLFFFVIFNDKKSWQAGELSIYKQLCTVVISQKRHFQKKHKNNLLFKHFISSLQSCIRVKYISVGFKFTLENERSEIFGVILNHNSFHIDKALPCRGQIKEQLYILMRWTIPFGKFQDTTAYSYVYVFVLVLMILKVCCLFHNLWLQLKRASNIRKSKYLSCKMDMLWRWQYLQIPFFWTVGSLAPIYVNVVKTNVNSIHPQTENDAIIPFSWKHNGGDILLGFCGFLQKQKANPLPNTTWTR